jgi:hypothetical protein
MTTPDILFIITLHNYTRVFDDGRSLRLEWSREGLKVCKNTGSAIVKCPANTQIPLSEESVIGWNTFDRGQSYRVFQDNVVVCEFRVFDHDDSEWLEFTNGEATLEIMTQWALALESLYGSLTSVEKLRECITKVETVFPINEDDTFRQLLLKRWRRKLREVSAAAFSSQHSTKEQIRIAFETLKMDKNK